MGISSRFSGKPITFFMADRSPGVVRRMPLRCSYRTCMVHRCQQLLSFYKTTGSAVVENRTFATGVRRIPAEGQKEDAPFGFRQQ